MQKKFLKLLKAKGQAMLLYALLTPIALMVGGTGIDLGWYYFNVARLQNAADSAAVAGAQELMKKDNSLSDYRFSNLAERPKTYEENTKRKTDEGDMIAKKYANNNLGTTSYLGDDTVTDSWSGNIVSFDSKLYGQNNPDDIFYYVVLEESHQHLFEVLQRIIGNMDIKVSATAKISRFEPVEDPESGPSLVTQMDRIRDSSLYSYFEVMQEEYRNLNKSYKDQMAAETQAAIEKAQKDGIDVEEAKKKVYDKWVAIVTKTYTDRGVDAKTANERAVKDLTGDRSLDKARERSVQTSGNCWLKGLTRYRTENSTIKGLGGTSWKEYQLDFDDLFVDFKADVSYKFTQDWDVGYPLPEGANITKFFTSYNKCFYDQTDDENIGKQCRIISVLGVEKDAKNQFPYKIRKDKEAPDPLLIRIESEPVKWEPYYNSGHTNWNSVHQIIINVNASNFDEANDRPLIFFYDGPRKIDENSHVRDSKPIILNLNADFRGVLYAPYSQVSVCGNNHRFKGFIVAKEFVNLKTDEDFEEEGLVKAVRRDSMTYTKLNDDNTIKIIATEKNENEIYIAEDEIKELNDGEDIPENCIRVKYDGETNYYIDRDAEFYEKLTTVKLDTKYDQIFSPLFVNNKAHKELNIPSGDVQIRGAVNATHAGEHIAKRNTEADKRFDRKDFKLLSSEYDDFKLVKFVNYTYLNGSGDKDNMFVYSRAKNVY